MSRRTGLREKLVRRRGKLRQATFKFVTVAWPNREHATELYFQKPKMPLEVSQLNSFCCHQ